MADLLITGGLVVTCEKDVLSGQFIPDGAVAVQGHKIVEVGSTAELVSKYGSSARSVDASGCIVMPGFVITHTHMPYVLGHNMPVDFSQLQSFWDMLQKIRMAGEYDGFRCTFIPVRAGFAVPRLTAKTVTQSGGPT